MRITAEDSILINIDFQQRLMPHMFNKDELRKKTVGLIKGCEALGLPIIMTQQYTKGLGYTDPEISAAAGYENPEELPYIEKTSFSCFDCPEFKEVIEKSGKKNILITGIEGHVCVMQTIVDLKAAGFNPVAIIDCISSRKEADYQNGVRRYIQEGAMISCLESILFELCRSSKDPAFKEISSIVK